MPTVLILKSICVLMRRYCARRCTMSVYGRKCKVESLFTLNLEEEDDGTPVTLDCVCSYHKYKRGCLSTYQTVWDEVLDEFEANCSKSPVSASPVKILVIGGSSDRSSMEIYSPDVPKENHLLVKAKLRNPRGFHISFLTMDKMVVTVGGASVTSTLSSCEILDPEKGTVSKCKDMKQGRVNAASAVLNEVAYVCGGLDRNQNGLSSCEKYNSDSGTWSDTSVASLKTERSAFAMLTVGSVVYAIGGSNKDNSLNTVELYDPLLDTWSLLASQM